MYGQLLAIAVNRRDQWNRCDVCGRFIAFEDFENGAVRRLVTPDAEGTREEYETLCKDCAK
jgi:hypothetical protein